MHRARLSIQTTLLLLVASATNLPQVALAKPLTDAEISEKLRLPPGAKIIRQNGQRMLLSPLDDEMVNRMVEARVQMDKHFADDGVADRDPRHAASEEIYWKARALMDNHDVKAALPLLTQYIEKFNAESKAMKNERKDEHNYFLSWGYQARGFCHLQLQQLEEGIADCSEAIRLRPKYIENYKNRARAYRLLGKSKLAEYDEAEIKALTAEAAEDKLPPGTHLLLPQY